MLAEKVYRGPLNTGLIVGIFIITAWELENTAIRINVVKEGKSDGLELTEEILQCVSSSFVWVCTQLYFCINFIKSSA